MTLKKQTNENLLLNVTYAQETQDKKLRSATVARNYFTTDVKP